MELRSSGAVSSGGGREGSADDRGDGRVQGPAVSEAVGDHCEPGGWMADQLPLQAFSCAIVDLSPVCPARPSQFSSPDPQTIADGGLAILKRDVRITAL